MKKETKKALTRSLKDTLPILAGYLVLGIGFGFMLAKAGFATYWALIMSVTMYAGSMQYVGVGLIAEAVSVGYAVMMTVLVNIRHVFYGVSLIDKYRGTGWRKVYMMFALTDETYSLVSTTELPEGVDKKKYYFFVSVFDQFYWICGCCIGCFLGNFLDGFNSAGIEYAMTALFVCIFADQWITSGRKLITKRHISAVVGVASTLGSLIVCNMLGTEYFLIPSMIIILVALILLRPVLDRKGEKEDA
ncbi:MAG: branched-chain amino acid transporter AzlC [Ruminococcaceae bacterium]|nr:branched-chain amino acid transporter AzlC [Oscillospiraceae bacterium]